MKKIPLTQEEQEKLNEIHEIYLQGILLGLDLEAKKNSLWAIFQKRVGVKERMMMNCKEAAIYEMTAEEWEKELKKQHR